MNFCKEMLFFFVEKQKQNKSFLIIKSVPLKKYVSKRTIKTNQKQKHENNDKNIANGQ